MTITEFLQARIEDDQQRAKYVEAYGDTGGLFNPARVLAECAAKRAIIELWEDPSDVDGTTADVDAGCTMGIEAAVKALAAVYSDHPDYQESWNA